MSSKPGGVFQFKVPIPSSILQNAPSRNQAETSSQSLRLGGYGLQSSINSTWGGSHGSRNNRRFMENRSQREMPPPRAIGYSKKPQNSLVDESSVQNSTFFNNKMVHSTPVHHTNAGNQQKLCLFRPLAESSVAASNWSGLGSSFRGNGSVHSFSSNNVDFVDKLFQKALQKYLAKGGFNHEYANLAIQVANELKCHAQEVAAEIVPDNGSIRSHYSKYASSWRSGTSKGHDTIQSLQKIREVTQRTIQVASPTKSIHCSMERVNKKRRYCAGRITEEPAESEVTTTFSVVEKTIQLSKRNATPELSSERECSEPQTVRRRPPDNDQVNGPSTTIVQGLESPTSTCPNVGPQKNKTDRKNGKPTLADALAGRTGLLTLDDDDDFVAPSAVKIKKMTKKKPGKTQKSKAVENENLSKPSAIAVAILTVSNTRSGRNVKRPSLYQAAPRPKSKKSGKEKIAPVKSDGNDEKKMEKLSKKPVARKAQKPSAPTPLPVDEPVVVTKRGRAVKPTTLYGAIKIFTPSPVVPKATAKKSKTAAAKASPKKPIPKTTKNGKAKSTDLQLAIEQLPPPQPSNNDDSDNELDVSGIDFYIPEVTQSTRRGVAKSKVATARALGIQTPPLTYFTANLHSDIVASANTGRSTPDWQPSQRTESEAQELQKRKLKPKKKAIEPPKKSRPPKKKLSTQTILKMARREMAQKQRKSPSSSFESDLTDESDME